VTLVPSPAHRSALPGSVLRRKHEGMTTSHPGLTRERTADRSASSQTVRPPIEVILRGRLPLRAKEYAISKIGHLAHLAPWAVGPVRVKITRTHHRALGDHVMVEVNLEARGRPVRVQVAAASSHEGIDLAQDRLRRKLSQLGRHPARHTGRERSHRPGYANRPVDQREVVRHKAFVPAVATTDEAVFDLEMMDYDFQLYTDALSGVDSVVYRDGFEGYRISRLDGNAAPTGSAARVLVDPWPAPRMTPAAASGALDATDAPFVFFADPGTGRGNVLYRRHDGHYGLITPAV
jgi:ribosome-associated translation inhibitor RaiA